MGRHPRPSPAAFTLVELLIVISIISTLLGLLLPALNLARQHALTTKCMANMRNMEVAQMMYCTVWEGALIDVGLAHGGAHADEEVAWINTLQEYYGQKLLHRSPVDRSPHWPREEGGAGVPIPGAGATDLFRRTSYGINNYLTSVAPFEPYRNLNKIRRPSATVQFLIMAYEGGFAGADHTHVENWGADAHTPLRAAQQVQIDAHGGPPKSFESRGNYGYLDGHAETLKLEEVYVNFSYNRFDPVVAR